MTEVRVIVKELKENSETLTQRSKRILNLSLKKAVNKKIVINKMLRDKINKKKKSTLV